MASSLSDEILFEQARGGDHHAFNSLYQRHRKSVFDFLYRLSGSAKVAEDITHDCFLKLIRTSDSFVASTPFQIRLYWTARTLVMKSLELGSPTKFEAKDETVDQPSTLRIRNAISSLPLFERETLILAEYEGFEVDQIAAVVDADENTVRARLDSGRERLRLALADFM